MKSIKETAPTRGNLIPDFLETKKTGKEYLLKLQDGAERYNGFNLLVGDSTGIYHYSNISDVITKIEPGIHGVSNALLNTPWPKLEKAKEMLKRNYRMKTFLKRPCSTYSMTKPKLRKTNSQIQACLMN